MFERFHFQVWVGGSLLLTLLLTGCGPQRPRGSKTLPPPPHVRPAPPVQPEAIDPQLRDAARAVLVHDSHSDNPDLLIQAIESMQNNAPDLAIDPTLRELSNPDERVRFAACIAAGQLHLIPAHARLLHMHDSDRSLVAQIGVHFALHRLGDTRFSHDFERYCVDLHPEIRGRAALVLGLMRESSAVSLLKPLLRDPSQPVRLQAAESIWLLHVEGGAALNDLLGYALSGYTDDLILATLALAGPRDKSIAQHIRANLTTDFPEVNLAAARAMGMLGSDEGYNVAIQYIKSVDPRQRAMAALAFGAIGRADTQHLLADALADRDEAAALAAATGLLQLHESHPIVPQ